MTLACCLNLKETNVSSSPNFPNQGSHTLIVYLTKQRSLESNSWILFFFYIFGKRLYGIISFHKPIKKNIDLFLLTRYVFPSFINSKKISNKTVQSSFFFLLKSNLKIKVAHPNKKCINNAPSINFFFSTKNLAQIINDVHILSWYTIIDDHAYKWKTIKQHIVPMDTTAISRRPITICKSRKLFRLSQYRVSRSLERP